MRAELECLAAGVLELRAHGGRDQIPALDPLEAVAPKDLRVLCFQQRAGNSARPEIDVAPAFLAHGALDREVRDLDPAARAENPG
jgi:hypothetical protein